MKTFVLAVAAAMLLAGGAAAKPSATLATTPATNLAQVKYQVPAWLYDMILERRMKKCKEGTGSCTRCPNW